MKLVALGAALAALAASAPPQDGGSLALAATRFHRAGGAGAQTEVDAFARVPFGLLDPLVTGPNGFAIFRIAVSVRDTAGLELLAQSWTQRIPARALGLHRGSAVEHFTFAARPGRYRVGVTVTDSATGRVGRAELAVEAFAAAPVASDLLLTTGIRAAGAAEPRPGELRKGAVLIEATDRPVLTPQQARLGYYLEIYRAAAETVGVTLRVRRPDGSAVITAGSQRLDLPAGGGVTRGMLDLAGLPPGEYRLEAVVATRDSQASREAVFTMGGFETEQAVAAAVPPPEDAFVGMTEAQLDTLYLPLIYLMTSDEQGIFPGLTLDGKRAFLRQFWTKRDPTPGTPRNEEQEAFYSRIREANRRFREGGAADIPGWRTDRGRIFIRYGPPDEILDRPEAASTNPYEVWKYTRGRLRKYAFQDQTKFGNYVLIWTDDIREPSRPNWQDLLGREGVEDVRRF